MHSDNDFATVAYLRVKKASLIAKGHSANAQLTVPPILSQPFVALRDTISDSSGQQPPDGDFKAARMYSTHSTARTVTSKRIGNWVAVTNVQRQVDEPPHEMSLQNEVQECFDKLKGMFIAPRPQTYRADTIPRRHRIPGVAFAHSRELCKHQHFHLLDGPLRTSQRGLRDILRHESSSSCMRRRRSPLSRPRPA